ncbi:MAG: hypothetical protein IPJ17_05535 [Holophagales bacterium]|nr:MAG: hypothetical protein IPJ17_05535 [Holophagales bacterium]
MLLDERELFMPFAEFRWFAEASVGAILDVSCPQPHPLDWPDLDADLAVESIEHPERYPRRSKVLAASSWIVGQHSESNVERVRSFRRARADKRGLKRPAELKRRTVGASRSPPLR